MTTELGHKTARKMELGHQKRVRSFASVAFPLPPPRGSGNGYHCPKSPTRAHHWDIETPNGGATVRGWCRYCPETREFQACFDESGIDYCAELGRLLI